MDVETGRKRTGVVVVGAILVLIGLVWTGQGAGYIGGSFMTGRSLWLYIGLATICVGTGLVVWGRRGGPTAD